MANPNPSTNEFLNADQTAALTLALVTKDFELASTLRRDFEQYFEGGKGHVVNVKVPNALKARSRDLDDTTNEIVLDSLGEAVFPVTIDTHVYSAVGLSEQDISLDLQNFGEQVLAPQAEAVVEDVEHRVAEFIKALPSATIATYDAADPVDFFTAARKTLRDRSLPATGLWAVVGTKVYKDLIDAGAFRDASQSGSGSALLDAEVKRVAGFSVIESNRLGENEVVFYHRDSFSLVVRAPKVPMGVPAGQGATVSRKGFALRHIMDYDIRYTQDRSMVSAFIGIAALPVYRVATDAEIVAAQAVLDDVVEPLPTADELATARVTVKNRVITVASVLHDTDVTAA